VKAFLTRTGKATTLGLALLLVPLLSLIFLNLGSESLLGDEALYAAVARDSAAAGPWWPLVYDGEPYAGKPPLGIWMQRIAFAFFGFDEAVARAPSAVAGALAIVLFVFGTARRHGATAAAVAGALLATGHFLLIRHGLRQAVFEGPLLLATVGAVTSLTSTTHQERRFGSAPLWCAFGAAMKGVIAPALVFVIGGLHALLAGRRRPARFFPRWLLTIASGLAVTAAWLAALGSAPGRSVLDVVRHEIWDRATVGIDPEHLGGPEVYAQVLARDLGPWLLLGAAGILAFSRRRIENGKPDDSRDGWSVAAAWAVAPTLLVLVSASKLPWYIYPALPGYALLAGLGAAAVRRRLAALRPVWGWIAIALLFATLIPRWSARYRRVTADRPEQVTLRVLADLASRDSRRVVLYDRIDTGPDSRIREWHWLYLNVAPRLSIGLDARLGSGDCPLVVTPRPAEAAAKLGLGAAPRAKVYAVGLREPALWVLDGCGGEVAARLAALRVPPAPQPPVAGSTG
jgi:4-amino-4-deoxy-L-arabinose transferase-like glycosyltransferase